MSKLLLVVVAIAALSRPAAACLWDYDTLQEETFKQEDVTSIITGDLHKHSQAFYIAKVDYTRAIIAKGGAPKERYDDLAVALAKLGRVDDALAILDDKDKVFPGEYTTEANRGTFLAIKGDLAGAIDHLNKGIAINPDAHFGREKYQLQFLDYLQRLAADKSVARENFLGLDNGRWAGDSTLIMHVERGQIARKVPTPPVIAISAMIRFGEGEDSPHLWYALGWAFIDEGDSQLAARAFRRAELLGHPRAANDGAVLSTVIHEFRAACCTTADHPEVQAVWAKISKRADAEWARGQAVEAHRQEVEDRKLARKQFKAVFGY